MSIIEEQPEQNITTTTNLNENDNTTVTATTEEEQQPTTNSIQEYIKSLDQDYFTEIKENAKLKAFTVLFEDNKKKIYTRRKVTMKEIGEIERKREILRVGKGSPLDKANALLDFYWFSAQCHLRETKTGKPMPKTDYENVTFEDFRKIIDACEFIMLYGVPKS